MGDPRLLDTNNANMISPHEVLHLLELDIGQALDVPRRNVRLASAGSKKTQVYEMIAAITLVPGGCW